MAEFRATLPLFKFERPDHSGPLNEMGIVSAGVQMPHAGSNVPYCSTEQDQALGQCVDTKNVPGECPVPKSTDSSTSGLLTGGRV